MGFNANAALIDLISVGLAAEDLIFNPVLPIENVRIEITNEGEDTLNDISINYQLWRFGDPEPVFSTLLGPFNLATGETISLDSTTPISTTINPPGGILLAGSYSVSANVDGVPGENFFVNNVDSKFVTIREPLYEITIDDTNLFLLPFIVIVVLAILARSTKN